jgi:hypothetical protein
MTSALWVISLLGCGPGADPSGVWAADVRYTALNGGAYDWAAGEAVRFDPGSKRHPVAALNGTTVDATVHRNGLELAADASRDGDGFTDRVEQTWTLEGDPDLGPLSGDAEYVETFTPEGEAEQTFDLTGQVDLVRVERFDDAEADGLAVLGEYGGFDAGGYAVNVRQRDGIAYLARYEDGLRILDGTDPAAIAEVGHVTPIGGAGDIWNDVKLFDYLGSRYALMASNKTGLVIVDVTDPGAAAIVSQWPPVSAGYTVFDVHTIWLDQSSGLAYLGEIGSETADAAPGDGGLDIVSVADPANPRLMGRWAASEVDGTIVHDLMVKDGIAYLCAWDAGLAIVDVHNPVQPQLLGRFDDYERRTSHSVWVDRIGDRLIALHGDEDFGAHLRVLDVTNPAQPFALAEWQTRPEVSIHNVRLDGPKATIAYYQDGVRILDLSNPVEPVQTAFLNTWDPDAPGAGALFYEGTVGIDVADDGRLWIADSERGLIVAE